MKKLLISIVAFACFAFIATLILNQVSAGNSPSGASVGKEIPANVMKIADKSCVKCHTEPGNHMAIAHLNLSNWDKYSAEKQAAKAKDMCKMVTKDKMPPKSYKAKNHYDGPTPEELKTLCDWAESLQTDKK